MYRLLIADDEENIRLGIRDCVCWEQIGIRVTAVASSGREALEMIRLTAPDVAIIDVNMPDMSGLELIEAVQKENITNTAFLILSGYDQFSYVQQALRMKVEDYLLKPCTPKELQEAVVKALRRKSNTDWRTEGLSSTMSRAVEYIRENYAQVLSLDIVSEQAGVSSAYLSSLFRRELDSNFVDFVNKIRVQEAKRLLETGIFRNIEVAFAVGFTSEKYFSRVFKKHVGMTASEYRQHYRSAVCSGEEKLQ